MLKVKNCVLVKAKYAKVLHAIMDIIDCQELWIYG